MNNSEIMCCGKSSTTRKIADPDRLQKKTRHQAARARNRRATVVADEVRQRRAGGTLGFRKTDDWLNTQSLEILALIRKVASFVVWKNLTRQ